MNKIRLRPILAKRRSQHLPKETALVEGVLGISRDNLNVGHIAGTADCLQLTGYITHIGPTPFLALAIAVKLLAAPSTPHKFQTLHKVWPLIFVVPMLQMVCYLASPYQLASDALQIVAFGLSLTLTLLLVPDRTRLSGYCRAVSFCIVLSSLLYLAELRTGHIVDNWGRKSWFNEYQPNLGNEIASVGVVATLVELPFMACLPRLVIMLIPVFFMQGRAALLTILLALCLRGYLWLKAGGKKYGAIVWFGIASVVPLTVFAAWNAIVSATNAAFMLDDKYRGGGTGFVGRSDRWGNGLTLFLDRPLTGNGPSAFEMLDLDNPHNFYLFGLSEMGLLFSVVLIILASYAVKAWQFNRSRALIMISFLVETFFNDRFLNLAPYPFIVIAILASLSFGDRSAERLALPRKRAVSPVIQWRTAVVRPR